MVTNKNNIHKCFGCRKRFDSDAELQAHIREFHSKVKKRKG